MKFSIACYVIFAATLLAFLPLPWEGALALVLLVLGACYVAGYTMRHNKSVAMFAGFFLAYIAFSLVCVIRFGVSMPWTFALVILPLLCWMVGAVRGSVLN